jgi:hypothetical protein
MKQIIVTGGRDYSDRETLRAVLNFLNPDLVIQGGASGADRLAKIWAESNGKIFMTVEADWSKHGKAAGPMRNREMLRIYPDAVVVAFPGGSGTANCVKTALELNRTVLQVRK